MKSYSAKIAKIGINPYMHVPEDFLNSLIEQGGLHHLLEGRDQPPKSNCDRGENFRKDLGNEKFIYSQSSSYD